MRLTTLARKIEKTPNQLISFLEENNIDVSTGLHGKLETKTVELVINYFMPEQNIEESLASKDDIEITKRLKDACELIGIKYLDHVIVCEDDYVSFADSGLL